MSFAGRIIYNSIVFDFVRQWSDFAVRKAQHQAISRSAARIRETLNFANQDLIQARRERITAQELAELLQFNEYAKDGSSFEFLRDRDFGGYWNFEKTLNNNDEVAGTFTRTHVANSDSYIDPSTGLITFAGAADTPRYPGGKYGHGIIVEGSRTNIVQNQGMDHADWVKTNFTVSDNDTTELLDPAGGNNADKITAAANNATAILTPAVAVGTDDGAFSVWIACPSGTVAGSIIIDDDSDSNTTTQAFTATPEWQRIQVVYENIGDPSDNWQVTIKIDTSADVLYIYGPQLEVGADVLFMSNFILTAGATVTRNDELLLYAAANIVNKLKGSIGFWFKPEWIYNKHANACLLWIHDSGDAGRHTSIYALSTGNLEYRVYDGTGTANEIVFSMSGISQDTWHHLFFTYDTTIANGLKIYIDGALVATDTNDAFVPEVIGTSIALGATAAGGDESFCEFDEVIIRKDVLPVSTINQIYQQGVGLGEIRNRWASVALTNPDFLEEQLKGINRYNFQLLMEEILS